MLDTTETKQGGCEPEAGLPAAHTVIASCIAEMEEVRIALRSPLTLPDLTRLRLRLDACARIVTATKIQEKTPPPLTAQADPLAAYRTPPAPQKPRRRAPAPPTLDFAPAPEPDPAPAALDF